MHIAVAVIDRSTFRLGNGIYVPFPDAVSIVPFLEDILAVIKIGYIARTFGLPETLGGEEIKAVGEIYFKHKKLVVPEHIILIYSETFRVCAQTHIAKDPVNGRIGNSL